MTMPLPLPDALGVLAAASASASASASVAASNVSSSEHSNNTSGQNSPQFQNQNINVNNSIPSSNQIQNSSSEHQVLEALTKLRSSSSSSSANNNNNNNNNNSNNTSTTHNSLPPAKIPISHLLEATSLTNNNTTKITKKTQRKRLQPTLPKSFPCPHCTKCFTRKSNLDSHLITHSRNRPHICDSCNKAFARLSDRTRHIQTTHGPSRIFQCRGSTSIKNLTNLNEWGCSHYYSRADGLRKHFRSHAGRHCLLAFIAGNPEIFNTSEICKNPETALDDPKLVELAVLNVRSHCGW